MFEKHITEAAQRLNVPTATVSSVLISLMGYMTNERTGGINGFVDSFRRAGIGEVVTSWFGGKQGKHITPSNIEAALTTSGVQRIADASGVTRVVAGSTIALLLPRLIALLTPNGTLPTNELARQTIAKVLNTPPPVPQRFAEPRSTPRWLPWAAAAALALAAFFLMRDRTPAIPQVAVDSSRIVRETAAGSLPSTATSPSSAASDLLGVTWQLANIATPIEQRTIDSPDRYTIRFDSGGRVAVRADCNRGSGTYTISSDRRLMVNPLALTRAACSPGSISERFAAQVSRAIRYEVRAGDLYLTVASDSATLRFRRSPN